MLAGLGMMLMRMREDWKRWAERSQWGISQPYHRWLRPKKLGSYCWAETGKGMWEIAGKSFKSGRDQEHTGFGIGEFLVSYYKGDIRRSGATTRDLKRWRHDHWDGVDKVNMWLEEWRRNGYEATHNENGLVNVSEICPMIWQGNAWVQRI